ncbi:FapA family protein [Paenalkalicoccus suaedae]|uniref:FapA family protein n=1 Tax=Paenalkalicoccus suaedae TaxID=2592382 RepID=A0A859FDV7_9BACI|nr:flagellar assembly protein A [Paenalkalicoccus suaedae]QKS71041.1 FapA family protein [Paenalkalicoccus suaedae]
MTQDTQATIYEANTVKEAIEAGLADLNITENEADIVIIQKESDKFWGVKKKRAKIRISRKQRETWEDWILDEVSSNSFPVQMKEHEIRSHLDGKVWIRDGQIQFKDSPTNKPVIVTTEGMTLYKNGEKVNDRTILTEGDVITFDLETVAIETTWSIRVDEKKQQVSLRVNPGKFYVPCIIDEPPTETLTIKLKQEEQINNQLYEHDVIKQLEQMRIVHGINQDAIKQACRSTASMTVTIAEGELPKHGRDGEVDFYIDITERSRPFTENSDGTADFRESSYIPSLKEGEVLGQIKEPTKGEDGKSIYGDVLKARDGQPVVLKPGTGVEFLDEENKVVATNKGRPHIERLGRTVKISILPKLMHRGDVDVASGNIHFIGDVEILGSINEGMLVHAEGQVALYRHVMQGIVQAKSHILINGNVIRGTIVAGATNSLYAELAAQLKPFVEDYLHCIQTIKQLSKNPKFEEVFKQHSSLSPIIKLLMESSSKRLMVSSTRLVETIQAMESKIDKRWKSLASLIEVGLLKFHSKGFQSIGDMETLYNEAASLLDYASIPSSNKANVEINYAMNSTITASGDVTIKGKGAIHTSIEAEGTITVRGKVIGGKLYGKKGVHVVEAGSLAGVKTIIQTDKDSMINITTCYSDVVLVVGSEAYKLTKDSTHIQAKQDKKGLLTLQ